MNILHKIKKANLLKILQLSITTDSARKLPLSYEKGMRGTFHLFKNLSNLNNCDSYLCNFENEIVFFNIKTKKQIKVESFELLSIFNSYDIILIEIFKKPLKNTNILKDFIINLIKNKSIKIYIEHDFLPRGRRTFDTAFYPQLLQSCDYISLYSYQNNYIEKVFSKFVDFNHRRNPYFKGRCYIDTKNLFNDIEDSFIINKNKYTIVESGSYEICKGHDNIGLFLKHILKNFNDKYCYLHYGLKFNPQTYHSFFKSIELLKMRTYKNSTIKAFPYDFNNDLTFSERIVLLGEYEQNFNIELLKKTKYSISLMTPKIKQVNKYVTDRFELAQIEKCLFTLPILEEGFLKLFVNMPQEIKNCFLKFNIDSPEVSMINLKKEMEYLDSNNAEYNKRRQRIINFIFHENDIRIFENLLTNILKSGKNTLFTIDKLNSEKIFLKDFGLTANIFKKLFLEKGDLK